jgi:protein phosphatase
VSDPAGPIVISVAGITHTGRSRDHNEDTYAYGLLGGERRSGPSVTRDRYVLDGGFALGVYDGVGRVAAETAAAAVHATLAKEAPPASEDALRERLERAVVDANRAVFEATDDSRHGGMGTTATVAALVDACVVIAHAGDSRAYLLRGRRLVQLTQDDRLTRELARRAAPELTEAELVALPSNVITKALGMSGHLEPAMSRLVLRRGDVLLLCTDGIWQIVGAPTIRAVLLRQRDPGAACRVLCDEALRAGGPDNLTAVIARFDGEGLRPPIRAESIS